FPSTRSRSSESKPNQGTGKPPLRVDQYGDSLPAGAVARLGTLRLKHQQAVACVAFAPDGKTIASGAEDGTVCIWDAMTGQEIRRLKVEKTWVAHIAFAPDGKTLATVVGVRHWYVVQFWETDTGRELHRTGNIPCDSPILSPDLKLVAG